MFGMGMPELLIILAIIFFIFGAGKLPQIGSALGKGINNFKRSVSGNDQSCNRPAKISDEKKSLTEGR